MKPVFVLLLLWVLAPAHAFAAPCTSAETGKQHFLSSVMEYCDGTKWVSMKVSPLTACTAADAGRCKYASSLYQFCDGASWQSMRGALVGPCTSAQNGKQRFYTSQMQYCDGTNWYQLGGCSPQWFGGLIYWDGTKYTAYGGTGCGWAYAYPPYGSGKMITFMPGIPGSATTGSIGTYLYWPCACCATAQLKVTYDGAHTFTVQVYGSSTGAANFGPVTITTTCP